MSEEMKAWVAWNPGAKVNVRLVDGWEEEMWAYQLNLSGEHHPTPIVAMELPLASRTPSANREADEPTEAMIEAGAKAYHDANRFQITSQKVRAIYTAMRQAALAAIGE